jgi:hypothetical protein
VVAFYLSSIELKSQDRKRMKKRKIRVDCTMIVNTISMLSDMFDGNKIAVLFCQISTIEGGY